VLSSGLGVSHARAGILRCAQPDHLMGASSKAAEVRWSNSLHALWRKIARETYGISTSTACTACVHESHNNIPSDPAPERSRWLAAK
jgi:hypothetical protein